jgi:hypothetical protein
VFRRLVSPLHRERLVALLLLILIFCGLTWAIWKFAITEAPIESAQGMGSDWWNSYRPALREWLAGGSPYISGKVFNPPWALVPLLPLALLPDAWATSILIVIGLFAFGAAAYRLKASPLVLVAFITCPWVLKAAVVGNLDWMVALGATLSPPIGLFLVLAKPQMGAAVAVFWLVEAYRKGGIKQAALMFAPVTIAFLLSFAVFGNFLGGGTQVVNQYWNAANWPFSIPVGIGLLGFALRKRKANLAISASPFFSPYVGFSSWSVPLLGMVAYRAEFLVSVAAIWLMTFFELLKIGG